MLTLTLLRHAKSSWGDPHQTDADRPLNARGRAAAPLIGAFAAAHGLVPDRILCSTAVRTRQTAALVLPCLPGPPPIDFLDELYLADPATLLRLVRNAAPGVRHLLLIGHNPGLHDLALSLVKHGADDDLRALSRKLPTGGLVVITFGVKSWRSIAPGAGRLTCFMTPRRLAREDDDETADD